MTLVIRWLSNLRLFRAVAPGVATHPELDVARSDAVRALEEADRHLNRDRPTPSVAHLGSALDQDAHPE